MESLGMESTFLDVSRKLYEAIHSVILTLRSLFDLIMAVSNVRKVWWKMFSISITGIMLVLPLPKYTQIVIGAKVFETSEITSHH